MSARPRQRILEAATKLLYQRGIDAAGVNDIVADADVAPMTLYRQFGGKDALVVAALGHWSDAWLDWLRERTRRGGSPEASLEGFWDALEEWFSMERFRGSLIENAAAELRSRPEHPAWGVIVAHRMALRQLLEELARMAGATDPSGAADQLQLLADGAVTVAMIDQRPAAAARGRTLATTVIAAA
jgi:AcrR family transcriptional regulator